MQLTIRRREKKSQDASTFTVLFGNLRYASGEFDLISRFGAPEFDALFADKGGRAVLESLTGILLEFPTVDEALDYIERVKQAIDATYALWQRGKTFDRDDDEVYPPVS